MIKNLSDKKIYYLTIIFLLFLYSQASADQKKNILILNSYHQGYKWTDDETRGILSALYPMNSNIKIYIEYMGAKWAFSRQYYEQLERLYKQKFRSVGFDVIIVTDDDAFNFLTLYRDTVFGKIPVVFCGVNWINPEKLTGLKPYTGINEDADIESNIYLMLKLHPATESIYIITDSTTTGKVIHDRINGLKPKFKSRVNLIIIDNIEMDSLLETISVLGSGSLILLTGFQLDKQGQFFEYNDSCSMITKSSKVPVYGIWDFNFGSGIIGGILTSGYSQGLMAGKIAQRILKGESADAIPVIMDNPNLYMFDYSMMRKFGIKKSEIPEDSIIINMHVPSYSISKKIFWSILTVIIIFMIVTILLILNIRRRFTAERMASDSEEKYHSLVDNLTMGVYRSAGHRNDIFLQSNPAMAKIFGYDSIEEFMKLPVSSFYQFPEHRTNFLEELSVNGSVSNKKIPMIKKDGTLMWATLNARAEFDETGKIKFIDGILEDISERKKLEDELRHAQKMETIGTLASGIAHDFNNSLGGLVGILSLFEHKIQSGFPITEDKLKQYVAIMKESSEKGANMVRRLLTLARSSEVELVPADLNDIIKKVIELLSGAIDKSIVTIYNNSPEKAISSVDPAQIEQVLLNLCINACHAMTIMRNDRRSWGGKLTISLEKITADRFFSEHHPEAVENEYLVISVSDTGVGMSGEILSRIFNPFFTTKSEEMGTGLGLAMVNSIIREHGGFIDVYSEPDTGTTFKIYLPVSHDEPENTRMTVNEIPFGEGLILIVDDEYPMRETAREILEECGYEVLTAENGESGVEIFREKHISIKAVVMDMAMPVKSGIVACTEMRRIDPEIRLLIASGLKQDKRIGEVMSTGITGFIEKPYTLEKLGKAVNDLINEN